MQNTTVPTLPSTTDVTATIPATATSPVTTTATTTTATTTATSAPCAGNVTQSFEYLCLQPTLDGLVLPANELPGPPYSNATVCHIDRPSQFVSQQVEYKIASQGPFLNVSLQNSGPSMGYDCCGVVDECSYKVDGAVGPNEIVPELYGVFSSMMELYCANVDDECNVTGNIYKIENTNAQGVAQIGQITVDGQIYLCPPTATRCLVCTPGVCNYECPARYGGVLYGVFLCVCFVCIGYWLLVLLVLFFVLDTWLTYLLLFHHSYNQSMFGQIP